MPDDIEQRLELLGSDCALAPDGAAGAAFDGLPCARVGDDTVLDPAGLVAYRRAGYVWAAWTALASLTRVATMPQARRYCTKVRRAEGC